MSLGQYSGFHFELFWAAGWTQEQKFGLGRGPGHGKGPGGGTGTQCWSQFFFGCCVALDGSLALSGPLSIPSLQWLHQQEHASNNPDF